MTFDRSSPKGTGTHKIVCAIEENNYVAFQADFETCYLAIQPGIVLATEGIAGRPSLTAVLVLIDFAGDTADDTVRRIRDSVGIAISINAFELA